MPVSKPGHAPDAARHQPAEVPPRPPANHRTTHCKTCRALCIWVVMPSGAKVLLNAIPHPAGDILLAPGRPATAWHVRGNETERELAGATRHTSHFVTCPDAKDWRRRPGGPHGSSA